MNMASNAVVACAEAPGMRPIAAAAAFRTMLLVVVAATVGLSVPVMLRAQGPSVVVTSGAAPLVVGVAQAGLAPNAVSDAGTRMTLEVTEPMSRLLVHTTDPIPANVTIQVTAQAPAGAFSLGPVVLDGTPRELLVGIPAGLYSGLVVTYTIAAQTSAGAILPSSANITFTLSSGL